MQNLSDYINGTSDYDIIAENFIGNIWRKIKGAFRKLFHFDKDQYAGRSMRYDGNYSTVPDFSDYTYNKWTPVDKNNKPIGMTSEAVEDNVSLMYYSDAVSGGNQNSKFDYTKFQKMMSNISDTDKLRFRKSIAYADKMAKASLDIINNYKYSYFFILYSDGHGHQVLLANIWTKGKQGEKTPAVIDTVETSFLFTKIWAQTKNTVKEEFCKKISDQLKEYGKGFTQPVTDSTVTPDIIMKKLGGKRNSRGENLSY